MKVNNFLGHIVRYHKFYVTAVDSPQSDESFFLNNLYLPVCKPIPKVFFETMNGIINRDDAIKPALSKFMIRLKKMKTQRYFVLYLDDVWDYEVCFLSMCILTDDKKAIKIQESIARIKLYLNGSIQSNHLTRQPVYIFDWINKINILPSDPMTYAHVYVDEKEKVFDYEQVRKIVSDFLGTVNDIDIELETGNALWLMKAGDVDPEFVDSEYLSAYWLEKNATFDESMAYTIFFEDAHNVNEADIEHVDTKSDFQYWYDRAVRVSDTDITSIVALQNAIQMHIDQIQGTPDDDVVKQAMLYNRFLQSSIDQTYGKWTAEQTEEINAITLKISLDVNRWLHGLKEASRPFKRKRPSGTDRKRLMTINSLTKDVISLEYVCTQPGEMVYFPCNRTRADTDIVQFTDAEGYINRKFDSKIIDNFCATRDWMPEYLHVYVFDTDETIVSQEHRYVFRNIPKENRAILGLGFPNNQQTGGNATGYNNLVITLGCVALTLVAAVTH